MSNSITNDPTLETRFWLKVDRRGPDECWNWTACINNTGYGTIRSGGKYGKVLKAHRVSWELHNGQIPDGLYCCHHCDNPACVNSDHLFVGTQRDNMRDMSKKGRSNAPKGADVKISKLTENQVMEIRRLYGTGEYTQTSLGEMYGVSQRSIGYIVWRLTWKHI